MLSRESAPNILQALYPEILPGNEGEDEPPDAPTAVLAPNQPQGPTPDPLVAAARDPANFVEAWLRHLGPASRRFWRLAAEYSVGHPRACRQSTHKSFVINGLGRLPVAARTSRKSNQGKELGQ
jgi:hypothetical protein